MISGDGKEGEREIDLVVRVRVCGARETGFSHEGRSSRGSGLVKSEATHINHGINTRTWAKA